MGTIRFNLRTDKADRAGLCPVELIYQIAGQRKYYRTKFKIRPCNWDSDIQRAIYINRVKAKELNISPPLDFDLLPSLKDIEGLNRGLLAVKSEIENIEKRFELDSVQYSISMVVDKLKEIYTPLEVREQPSTIVFDYIDQYIRQSELVRAKGSLSVYKNLRTSLSEFQQDTRTKITFSEIDASFFRAFRNFLVKPRTRLVNGKSKEIRLNNTTVSKRLSALKTFLSYAKSEGIQVSDRYKEFKISKPKNEVIALTNDEFERLFHLDLFNSKKLDRVRDIFCFSCSTGLRYSDLMLLKWENLKGDEIKLKVKKTKTELTIPLNPFSSAILKKYRGKLTPLPRISNQKLNSYIHELGELAEINEPIEIVREYGNHREAITSPKHDLVSIHTGRKTFITLSLEKGMSAEEVMRISGHEDYASFKRYVQITEKRKKESMSKAWGKPVVIHQTNLKAI